MFCIDTSMNCGNSSGSCSAGKRRITCRKLLIEAIGDLSWCETCDRNWPRISSRSRCVDSISFKACSRSVTSWNEASSAAEPS